MVKGVGHIAMSKIAIINLIVLYKNNGAVSCVERNVLFIWSLYLPTRCTQYFDTKLHGILPWADINRNCNTFFMHLHLSIWIAIIIYVKHL